MTGRRSISTILALACVLVACDADKRRELEAVECGELACKGLWAGTELWSTVYPITGPIIELAEVDASDVWACTTDPDVDMCLEVDPGRVGCFRVYGAWVVPVAPECADLGDGWLDVGVGMVAKAD